MASAHEASSASAFVRRTAVVEAARVSASQLLASVMPKVRASQLILPTYSLGSKLPRVPFAGDRHRLPAGSDELSMALRSPTLGSLGPDVW